MTTRFAFAIACLLASIQPTSAADAAKPVQVFILAGQSNMEGKAKVALRNQLRYRKAVCAIAHCNGHHEPQMRGDELVRGLSIPVLPPALREFGFFVGLQEGVFANVPDVS